MRLGCRILATCFVVVSCASDGGDASTDVVATDDAPDDDDGEASESTGSSGVDPTSSSGGSDASTSVASSSSDSSGGTTSTTDEEPLSPACGQPMTTDWFAPYTAEWGGETQRVTLDVDGVEREYIIELPEPYDPDVGYPLIVAFHGYNGTMDAAFGQQLASELEYQAIVAYPQGLPGDGASSTWSFDPDGIDVAMFDALVDQIGGELCVDRTRVFTWGFSQGSYLANVLACARGDAIAGSSPASGGMVLSSIDCVGPVPQFIVHGGADPVVSVEQGRMTRDIWLTVNGCTATMVDAGVENCVRYEECDSGAAVVYCEIPGGGHVLQQDVPGIEEAAIAFLRGL